MLLVLLLVTTGYCVLQESWAIDVEEKRTRGKDSKEELVKCI